MLRRGGPRSRLTFVSSALVGLGGRLSVLDGWTRLIRLSPLAGVRAAAAPSGSLIGVSRAVQLILLASIAERSFATASRLTFPACQTRSSNAPPLRMWCAIVCDESQRLFRLLAAGRARIVVRGMCAVHLYDVHVSRYLRRFWSLQARWLEECALRWPPFHICVWSAAGDLVGDGASSECALRWSGIVRVVAKIRDRDD